ncbi:MAG: discoidin domain-containing protein [Acidimicrobiales bacterium]|nr:discoidin domain-containing protein [Acidimicrobiales bacterium]
MRRWLAIACVGLVALACTDGENDLERTETASTDAARGTGAPDTTGPTEPWDPPEHRITIVDGQWVDRTTDEVFVPRGVNMVRFHDGRDSTFVTHVFDREQMSEDFAALAERGYNTVRLFLDGCDTGEGCLTISREVPGLNPEYLDVVAEVLELADEHGLVLLLTANDLPDGGGYAERSDRGNSEHFPGYRNTAFLTEAGHREMVTYWGDLLQGLVERQAPLDAVFAWSILNEHWLFAEQPPLSLDSGEVTTATGTYDVSDPDQKRAMVTDATRAMIRDVSDEIRRHDPDGLVTMGFFAPKFPNETMIGGDWYVDTAPLVEDSALDFFDFHSYPGTDITIEAKAENFGMDESTPVLMGEVGPFIDQYPDIERAALAVQRHIADSCAVGFDGWLYWAYERLPMSDATWGFTDDGGRVLDALAPVNQPDPCTATLADPNLVLGRPASASAALPENPPALAVDGDISTSWVSGAHAPQRIEIDLDEPSTIATIRLRVDQHPPGDTVHLIETRDRSGTWSEVHRFEGDTEFFDVLEATFTPPLTDVDGVRITTESSPSWVAWADVEVRSP